jgi:hypothetical protein
MLKTPVVFIIFKRPDTTKKVFKVIQELKPSQLFVIADGPRTGQIDEAEKCAETRAIIDRVDWNCKVFKNYSDINLGCAKRVSSGLNWAFDQVEEAIIIEDDCVLHPSFFPYSEELLERYRHDTRIFSISAQNIQMGYGRSEYSYYFSRYNHCWGWATWRRAWQYFDFDMSLWQEALAKDLLYDVLENRRAVNAWIDPLQKTYDGLISSWAYRWTFASWMQSGLSITPNVNLVHNIGFGSDATHWKGKRNKSSNIPVEAIEFPLKHPPYVLRHSIADDFSQKTAYQKSFFDQFKQTVKKGLKK